VVPGSAVSLAAGAFLALSASAWGQEQPTQVSLILTADQARLIVQTLGQLSCPTVAAMAQCRVAEETLREMQRQLRDQVK